MPLTIPSAALRQMTDDEWRRMVDAAFPSSSAVLKAYVLVLEARLREYEQRYELSSTALAAELASGRLRETADVSEWLFWASLRDDLVREARP